MVDVQQRDKKPEDKVNGILKNMTYRLVMQAFIWLRIQVDGLIDFFASLYWDPKRETIPPLDNQSKILLESASSLALKIRKKQIKSEDLVRTCVERIQLVNPIINSITDERYDAAIQEAKEIDSLIEAGLSDEQFKKKPFLGIPFTAKESYEVKGMLHTLGLVSRKNIRGEVDAEAVKLLKDAGGIIVAVTNVPEINKWQETRNMLFGQTANPYHTGRTVGGSSGGEAAIVSAVASPIGLCTDIGGSTRMPAFYCGLFGHNPTAGLTNMRGATLRTGRESEETMVSTGAVVKHSEDLLPILKILTSDKADLVKLDAPVNIKKLKYYYVDQSGDMRCSSVNPELQKCMKRVVENLQESTENSPVRVKFDGFRYMYRLWRYWMTREPADFPYLLTNCVGHASGLKELAKKLIGCSEFSLSAIFGLIDLQILPQEKENWAVSTTDKLRQELLETLGSDGVLLFHSTTQPAPFHLTCFLRPWNFGYWAVFNVLKFPVTQVPLGLNSDGIPVGIQVVSAPHNDRLCIAVARHLEESFGGFVPPCNTI